MSSLPEQDKLPDNLIDRREALRRVSALLGGVALVGGSALLTGCRDDRPGAKSAGDQASAGSTTTFSADDVAFLDEVAETILPETKTPGAKAAQVGAFMALMVTDSYGERDQKVFREGMKKLEEASKKSAGGSFMQATPQARLALLQSLDREQKSYTDARQAKDAAKAKAAAAKPGRADKLGKPKSADPATANKSDAYLPDQRQENAVSAEVGSATAISDDAPAHYFRMMKELALLGYFTSEIGYTKAQRYVEAPGRYDPCAPYKPGETAWAPHA